MPRALLGLGANQGTPAETFRAAIEALAADGQSRVISQSRNYRSAPVGGPLAQADYVNAAALVETSLRPEQLLTRLQQIEAQFGRVRHERWGPRTLDLDILLYDELVLAQTAPDLTIPHPRLTFRRFALQPAVEIASGMMHPQLRWTVAELLQNLERANRYLAVSGPRSVVTRHLLGQVAERTGAMFLAAPADYPATIGGGSLWRDVPRPTDYYEAQSAPGRVAERVLECLRQCMAALDAGHWSQPEQVAVGDFWLLELYAWGAAALAPAALAEYVDRFSSIASRHPLPTLLVMRSWLVTPRDEETEEPAADDLPGMLKIVSQEQSPLFHLGQTPSHTRGFAPVLWLTDPTVESQVDEISAAVIAMQTEVVPLT
ncbi:MAG: 2-amino-4-hydroxy-6-hydroxymethyldihydropteridine diphosphokinase [Planctomycetes bacterium]|nr:2-amino-4-hydroxy-6-hydroxymethyldihydropteridine diphosphokinase [Planctomycetota bacterium]